MGKTHSWVFKSPTGGQVCEPCGGGSSSKRWFSMKWEAQVIHSCPNCTLKGADISAVSPCCQGSSIYQPLSAKKCHPLCTLKHHKFNLSPCFCLGCKSPEAARGLGMGTCYKNTTSRSSSLWHKPRCLFHKHSPNHSHACTEQLLTVLQDSNQTFPLS